MEFDVNWLAVIAGTVVHQALGALWYGVIFRDTWIRAMGMNPEEIERQGPGGEMVIGALASLVSVTVLAYIVSETGSDSLWRGACWGAITGIGFVAASTAMNSVYEQKKPVVTVLFGAYYTLGLMIAGGILGVWR